MQACYLASHRALQTGSLLSFAGESRDTWETGGLPLLPVFPLNVHKDHPLCYKVPGLQAVPWAAGANIWHLGYRQIVRCAHSFSHLPSPPPPPPHLLESLPQPPPLSSSIDLQCQRQQAQARQCPPHTAFSAHSCKPKRGNTWPNVPVARFCYTSGSFLRHRLF